MESEASRMREELDQKLRADFPTVFLPLSREHGGDPFRFFGFEVNDGWYPLIYDAAMQLAALSPEIYAAQVKEKFGSMRFYIEFGDSVDNETRSKAWAITHEAEAASSKTCEDCGEPGAQGTSTGLGWIRTLCESCREAWRISRMENKK
jgi:hypothetical protein